MIRLLFGAGWLLLLSSLITISRGGENVWSPGYDVPVDTGFPKDLEAKVECLSPKYPWFADMKNQGYRNKRDSVGLQGIKLLCCTWKGEDCELLHTAFDYDEQGTWNYDDDAIKPVAALIGLEVFIQRKQDSTEVDNTGIWSVIPLYQTRDLDKNGTDRVMQNGLSIADKRDIPGMDSPVPIICSSYVQGITLYSENCNKDYCDRTGAHSLVIQCANRVVEV